MDELTKARAAIYERRSAPKTAMLTKAHAFHDEKGQDLVSAAQTGDGVLEGYSTRWWVVDSYGEFTIPGAFSKSIAERGPSASKQRIIFRYEHEHTVGRHTEMEEDADGLRIKAQISDDGMWGSVLRSHLRDGIPYGLSIGFRRVAERPATEADPLILDFAPDYIKRMVATDGVGFLIGLQEVKHLEDSGVSFPAVDPATVDGYHTDVLDLTRRHLEALVRDAENNRLTDEHQSLIRRLAALVPAASGPDSDERSDAPAASPDSTLSARTYYERCLELLEIGITV